MPVTETDIAIINMVVQEFLAAKRPTSRRPLIIKAKSHDVLDKLVRWSILKSDDHQSYLPRPLAFYFCGNDVSLRLARKSLAVVARALIQLFPDSLEDKFFSFDEMCEQAQKLSSDVNPASIELGLYLAPDFNLLAGWQGERAEMKSVRIGEPVLQIENPEQIWDTEIKRQTDWIAIQETASQTTVDQDGSEYIGLEAGLSDRIDVKTSMSQKVFVAHGHNEAVLNNVSEFLRNQLGLDPVVLHELPNKGRTIVEKLEANARDVGFAVVLLTPDDVGASKKRKNKLNKRARQNVILELGYFIGKLGRDKVAAVYLKDVELPSDFDGMLYVPYDRRGDWRSKLAREIKEAGIGIKEDQFKVNLERANEDALTGLLDRRFFDEALGQELKRAKEMNKTVSLILLDLDNFKRLNDTHGHLEGDLMLLRVGLVLQRTTPGEYIACRIGGDEFAVIAPGLAMEQANELAKRLRSALLADSVLKRMKVSRSFGVANFPSDGLIQEVLIRVGGERLYESKRGNRDR